MLHHLLVVALLHGPPQAEAPLPPLTALLQPGGIPPQAGDLEHGPPPCQFVPWIEEFIDPIQPLPLQPDAHLVVEPLRRQLIPDGFHRAVMHAPQPTHLTIKPGALHL